MSLSLTQVAADVCVSPQLELPSMAEVAAQGFRSVINNRPDFEAGPSQPTSADLEQAARAAGLEYAHLPVSPSVQTPQEIERFGQLLASMPRPILAFCRTGTRSGKLFQAASAA
jgi:uncharacterized protein (TIGR01244 family)